MNCSFGLFNWSCHLFSRSWVLLKKSRELSLWKEWFVVWSIVMMDLWSFFGTTLALAKCNFPAFNPCFGSHHSSLLIWCKTCGKSIADHMALWCLNAFVFIWTFMQKCGGVINFWWLHVHLEDIFIQNNLSVDQFVGLMSHQPWRDRCVSSLLLNYRIDPNIRRPRL